MQILDWNINEHNKYANIFVLFNTLVTSLFWDALPSSDFIEKFKN